MIDYNKWAGRWEFSRLADKLALSKEAAIKAYIDAPNAGPKSFRWTKSADDIVVAINRFSWQMTVIFSMAT